MQSRLLELTFLEEPRSGHQGAESIALALAETLDQVGKGVEIA